MHSPAGAPQIVRLVLGRTAALLAIGSAIGLVLALATGNILASVVYQSSASDPQVLASVFAAIALLGVISTWGAYPPGIEHRPHGRAPVRITQTARLVSTRLE